MAEAVLASALPGRQVRSAGLGALIGKPADAIAVELMRERRLDITAHRATQITRAMCLESDIVLVMEREQKQRLQRLYPETCGRVFRLGELQDVDVPDPYRQPTSVFRSSLSIIDDCVEQWLQRIQRL
jgi:protein-tyrosine phosphatase